MNKIKIYQVHSLLEIDEIVAAEKRSISFLAGGTDLMVLARSGKKIPPVWIDISQLHSIRGIKDNGDTIKIGALTTINELTISPIIKKFAPSLFKAAQLIGSPLIRNRATIGGNFGNASPAGDTIPPMIVHQARILIYSNGNSTSLKLKNFFIGPGHTVLNRGELITGFEIPKKNDVSGTFLRLGQRKALAISKASLAMALILDKNLNLIKDIKIALGAVGPTVIAAKRTEKLLEGKHLDADLIKIAQNEIIDECIPIDDIRSNALYRKKMIPILLERALLD